MIQSIRAHGQWNRDHEAKTTDGSGHPGNAHVPAIWLAVSASVCFYAVVAIVVAWLIA